MRHERYFDSWPTCFVRYDMAKPVEMEGGHGRRI
jgi:hypothetical protein